MAPAFRPSLGDLHVIFPSFTLIWRGAALMLGLAAVVPSRSGDLGAHPNPVRGYTEGVARARRTIASDDSIVAPGGSSILLVHGARRPLAVVLLHGLTDSPRQFAALAESLYKRGDNVYVPRLPHHAVRGANVGELSRLTAEELCRAGDQAIDIAAGLGDSIVVLGLSAGGTLAAWVGEHRPEVRRAVMVAPAFEITHIPSMLEWPLVRLVSRVPNLTYREAPERTRPDRDPGFATHGVAQVLRLGMAVRRDADRFTPQTTEMLFLVNAGDHTTKTAPVLDLARVWNKHGAPASIYEFPDSLALPHNVVDPVQHPHDVAAVYAVLEALAQGRQTPPWVRVKQ